MSIVLGTPDIIKNISKLDPQQMRPQVSLWAETTFLSPRDTRAAADRELARVQLFVTTSNRIVEIF